MNCGVNPRIVNQNLDGIALCLNCGLRVSVIVTYQVSVFHPQVQIPPALTSHETVNAPNIVCGACRKIARVRTSRQIVETLRWLRVYCNDEECGQRFNAYLELSEQLSVTKSGIKSGIPYRQGLLENSQRDLAYKNQLPRLIHD
jgi:transcription elongation factor Elf1